MRTRHSLSRALLMAMSIGLLATSPVRAHVEDNRLWLQMQAEIKLGERWRAALELQPRLRDDLDRLDQTIVRPSLTYLIGEGWSASLGYAYLDIRTASGSAIERRPWQQVAYNASHTGGLAWSVRARLEQRELSTAEASSNRLRLQARLTHALPDLPHWHALISHESFINLDAADWAGPRGFAQSRLLLGTMWTPRADRRVELGYLNQWIDNVGGRDNAVNHVIFLGLNQRF